MQNFESLLGNTRNAKTPADRIKAFIDGLKREAHDVMNTDMNQTQMGLDRLLTLDDNEAAELVSALDQHANGHAKAPTKVVAAESKSNHRKSAHR